MRSVGIETYYRSLQRNKEVGREQWTRGGSKFLKMTVENMTDYLESWLKEHDDTRKKPYAAQWMMDNSKRFPPFLLSFVTVRMVLNVLGTNNQSMRYMATCIGGYIESEMVGDYLRSMNSKIYSKAQEKLLKNTSLSRRMEILLRYTQRYSPDPTDIPSIPSDMKLRLGTFLIMVLLESSPMFGCRLQQKRGKSTRCEKLVYLTDDGKDVLTELHEYYALNTPFYWPTIIPPMPRLDYRRGGYWNTPLTLVRSKFHRKEWVRKVSNQQMLVPTEAIRCLENTGYKVYKPMYLVVKEIYEKGMNVGSLPPIDEIPLPPRPKELLPGNTVKIRELPEHRQEVIRAWKKSCVPIYDFNKRRISQRLQYQTILNVAEKFSSHDTIYFPYYFDFRGRAYPTTTLFNPQGPDLSRSLIRFKDKKPIDTPEAARWLAIAGANHYGVDKVSFDDRVQWVEDHLEPILLSAKDPLEHLWWTDADDPFQFLSWCMEWAGYQEQGEGYLSDYPIYLDGSCNGIQHFSAMLRDKEGGRAVNLLPSESPSDIYQTVADTLIKKLRKEAGSTETDTYQYAAAWVHYGIDRSLTKRSVMVLPYGGGLYSSVHYIQEHCQKKYHDKGIDYPYRSDPKKFDKAVWYLARKLQEAISDTVKGASVVMSWLQEIAGVVAEHGIFLNWTTPTGFYCEQPYRKRDKAVAKQIATKLGEKMTKYELHKYTEDQPDPRRHCNGVSPNFVHSLDSSAMQLTVCRASQESIDSIAVVHDSFGTHAADTERFSQIIRECFTEMYETNNVLEDFRDEVIKQLPEGTVLPEVPEMGELDIQDVLSSKFFFN